MKKAILLNFVFGFLVMGGIAHADLINVTLNWTMTETTGVEGYRMYYSYSNDMSGKILHSECGAPALSGGQYAMECTNVNIDPNQLPVYFQVVAHDNSNEAASPPQKESVLPVREFTMSTK